MLSSEDKPTDKGAGQQADSASEEQWQQINREQMFGLIDTILSFEACLYHQILPLKLEDKKLLLGAVNPQDNAAIDYVSGILCHIQTAMITKAIPADIHREILSAYLNYKNTSQSKVTVSSKVSESNTDNSITNNTQTHSSPTGASSTEDSLSLKKSQDTTTNNSNKDLPTLIHLSNGVSTSNTSFRESKHNVSSLHLPEVEILTPVDKLSVLPPRKMLEELLARVLVGGIGRLYLERRPYQGKILWSQNGVVQSVLDELPLSVFQGVLNELKRFTDIPVQTISEVQQVEKEYLCKRQRLLIRLRVMPGMYGEEATLQVLRGAALKFYQQQQVSRLSKDALGISQQLCYKLHQLQAKLLQNTNNDPKTIESLEALNSLLANLDRHIKNLSNSAEMR
ncbi:MAG: pilus assembly protein PilB [Cyanobacteria bacterium P01_A01_bin.84]